jgi:hypothetical protein
VCACIRCCMRLEEAAEEAEVWTPLADEALVWRRGRCVLL